MAVAWTADGVGQATKDWLVRDPVVVQASLPRFLAPGDQTRLRLDLAHATGPDGEVKVSLATPDPGLLPGAASFSGQLGANGRLTFEAPLVGTTPGRRHAHRHHDHPAGQELTKRLTVPIRANDPVLARQNRIELAAGQTLTLDAQVLDGLLPGSAEATVAIGPLAAFDVPGLLTSLEAYPWGCTEQTISRTMPLLYFAATAEGLGITGAADIEKRIDGAIRDVLARQTGAGGFGLWSAETSSDGWLDAYATDFLSRARAGGHAVPDQAFQSALGNLTNLVNAYGDFEKGGEDLAYALMVLAREGRAAIGDLRYYADTRANAFATPLAQAQLGAALALSGDQPRADTMFRLAGLAAEAGEPELLFRTDYGSGPRDAAGVLALAAEAGSDAVDRAALTGIVTAPGAERSTQEELWTLLAAHALAGDAALSSILINDAPAAGPALRLTEGDLPLRVTNSGTEPTLAVVTAFGVPTQPEPAQGNGYRIERQLLTLDGAPVDPAADRAQRPAGGAGEGHARARAAGAAHRLRPAPGRARDREPEPPPLGRDRPARLAPGRRRRHPLRVPRRPLRRGRRLAGLAVLHARLHGARRLARHLPPPGGQRRGHVSPGLPRAHRRGQRDDPRRLMTWRRPAAFLAAALASQPAPSSPSNAGSTRPCSRRSPPRPPPSSSTATARFSPPTPSPTAAGGSRSSSPTSIRATSRTLLAYEDRRFRRHPGVDPSALVRAALQLAPPRPHRLRRLDPDDAGRAPARRPARPRTAGAKLRQMR